MDIFQSPLMSLPGITPEEYSYLQQATTGLTEQQLRNFLMIYSSKRKNPSDILIFCLNRFYLFRQDYKDSSLGKLEWAFYTF